MPRRLAPWFDGDCHAAKKTTRRLEQVYWRSRQHQCRDSWQQDLADYRTPLRQKEQQYWNSRVALLAIHGRAYSKDFFQNNTHGGWLFFSVDIKIIMT